jgi:hypothetical protein
MPNSERAYLSTVPYTMHRIKPLLIALSSLKIAILL